MKYTVYLFIAFTGMLIACNPKTSPVTAKTNPASVSQNSIPAMQPLTDEEYRRWDEIFRSGTDFMATGNEPFWSVQMNMDKSITFKTAGGDSATGQAVKEIRLMDVAAGSYRTQTDKGLLNLIIYDRFCINDMSGDTLPKTVEVYLNEKKYSGCGRFLADYRLHDIWVLKSINDMAIDEKALVKGAPFLEINLTEHRIEGHSGCNGFGGPLEVKGRYISFLRLTGTMMACADGGFEKQYYQLLSKKEMPYEIENGWLTIHSDNARLKYRKVD